jgi:hypothetical protein
MIASSTVYDLKSRFRGELIAPGDQEYDAARSSPGAPDRTM